MLEHSDRKTQKVRVALRSRWIAGGPTEWMWVIALKLLAPLNTV
ncbi:hypothetical protein [Oscillatoria sp. HE19RPO]|nr:hypothetical protein [Oscillatoria sp. HE19RPO]